MKLLDKIQILIKTFDELYICINSILINVINMLIFLTIAGMRKHCR